ncbi:hypothetical protein [Micromonospora endolithica]|uniref:Uncharacterized protein n=1 Tax=Micromonospora endolithica TaxID=230091 RepID=A0A3A9ZQW4_9ACTN|nr:hypothetical protein [Micromonospora endolithica]RKN50541.1 hypothetical protein D7223_01805 [Micromonospora endolithica]TWJ20751.1 hypothetical protein JD76_00850 [Micromonospora endolithica]
MNLIDLRQVLDDRSVGSPGQVANQGRLRGVRTKVLARRRRRIATWTTAGVAAVVVAAAVVPGGRPDATPAPAVTPSPPRMIEGFPEYAQGARVVAATSGVAPEVRVEVTMVPTTLDLVVFTRCDGAGENVAIEQELRVNGRLLTEGTCAGSVRPDDVAGLGVVVGEPATFVMTTTGAQRYAESSAVAVPIPDGATFGFAVGERMPFERYPLPPRPSGAPTPLDRVPRNCAPTDCADAVVLRSDPADPNLPIRRSVRWRTLAQIDMVAQTPGLLHVRVDGVEVTTGEWWDYAMAGNGMYGDKDQGWKAAFGLDPRPGEQVTVEIVPEHVTGPWRVVLVPAQAVPGG